MLSITVFSLTQINSAGSTWSVNSIVRDSVTSCKCVRLLVIYINVRGNLCRFSLQFTFFPLQNGVTPLMVACLSGDICCQAALILIRHGARVNGLPNVCTQ